MKSKFFVLVLLLAVIAVGVGACGGDKKSSDAEIISIQGTPSPQAAWAKGSGDVFEATYYKDDFPVTSLSLTINVSEKASVPSGPYTFSGEPATCTVVVTAEDGTTKSWTLRANKHASLER